MDPLEKEPIKGLEGALPEEKLSEQGYAEVPVDMTDRVIERTKEELFELPNELRRSFERVAPGLGAEVFTRSQELSGKLLRQLQDSTERGDANQYGEFNDNTAVSDKRETMNFGDINRMVTALKMLADQLADQVRRQQGDTKTIDLDKLDGGEPRAVPEFWYILTGESEFGSGHEVQAGEYTLSTVQSQESEGPGAESRKLLIHKTGEPAEEPVDEAEEEVKPAKMADVTDLNAYRETRGEENKKVHEDGSWADVG